MEAQNEASLGAGKVSAISHTDKCPVPRSGQARRGPAPGLAAAKASQQLLFCQQALLKVAEWCSHKHLDSLGGGSLPTP